MESPSSTLLDVLTSQQFRTVTLLTLGLHVSQIADLLETSEEHVCRSLNESLQRADCPDTTTLALKLLKEVERDLYGEGLRKELAGLQKATQRMLEKVKLGFACDISLEPRDAALAKWVV